MILIRSFLTRLVYLALVLVAGLVAFFLIVQHGMIYHPTPYPAEQLQEYPEALPLSYSTSQGAQKSFFVLPRAEFAGCQPSKIWVIFSGNGSRALNWMRFVRNSPFKEDAFLLMDYPGYGACSGRPSPKSIEESADAAVFALASKLGMPATALEPRLGVLGHSLGAATALAFADAHPVSKIVLIAPFTSLMDMARIRVGSPICYLLMDEFDNRQRLRDITQRFPATPITVLFGKDDESIPFRMGQELARLFPKVDFEPLDHMGHVDILTLAQDQIYQAMSGPVPPRNQQSRNSGPQPDPDPHLILELLAILPVYKISMQSP